MAGAARGASGAHGPVLVLASVPPRQAEEDDQARRRSYIGSADIPMIAGLSPHGGPMDVYLRKVGAASYHDAEHLWIGRHLEPAIAAMFADRRGVPFAALEKGRFAVHAQEPWAGATPDYLVADGEAKAIVECKASFLMGERYWPSDAEDPTDAIVAQVTWQMGILRADGAQIERAFVPRLLVTGSFRIYEVEWSEPLFDHLLGLGRAFWLRHCDPAGSQELPPLDGSDAGTAALLARYPRATERLTPASPEAVLWVYAYLEASAREKRAAEDKAEARQHLQQEIGSGGGITGPGWKATWGNVAGAVDHALVGIRMAQMAGLVEPPQDVMEACRREGHRSLRITDIKTKKGAA